MIESAYWTLPIAVAVLVGVAGTMYFRTVVMRRDETAAGISRLSAMSWRDFIHLVLDALARRGYERVINHETPAGDDDYTLRRDGRYWLLSCKHGSAFVLGNAAVVAFASKIRLANAAGGILATQGRIADDARPSAALQHIELLDGATLWPELRDLIDPTRRADILAGAAARARQRTLLSWLLALVAGLATFMLLPDHPGKADTATIAAAVAAPASSRSQEAKDQALPAKPIESIPIPTDAATLETQRKDVADAISTLPMVDRAVWSTQSTIQVYLLDTSTDAMPRICPLLLRYEALAPSRVQLTPPVGSTALTRFRQCRSY